MPASTSPAIRLITLDPGHFHAALFHKEMLPGVGPQVHVYAPLGPDLLAHLNRLSQFNSRPDHPTHWTVEVHAGPDFEQRLLAERPGNVVVLSGRNRGKIERIHALAAANLHVLADKPWIIEPGEFPTLQKALDAADRAHIVAYDAMTQRFEITCLLQKALVNDPAIFGRPLDGSPDHPAVVMDSVHSLAKIVAGAPLLRPPWFFDIRQQGEGLTDAGTHLVDLVQWTLCPEQMLDYRTDLRLLRARRWPIRLTAPEFQRVTGQAAFPEFLKSALHDGRLEYFCNNSVAYTLRGVHVQITVTWELEAGDGGQDTERARYHGSLSTIEVRQGPEERFVPELYVLPNRAEDKAALGLALRRRLKLLAPAYAGLDIRELPDRFRLVIPESLRIGHEAHFALLTRQFLQYVRDPQSLPAWEKSFLLAKYYVTTQGVLLGRTGGSAP